LGALRLWFCNNFCLLLALALSCLGIPILTISPTTKYEQQGVCCSTVPFVRIEAMSGCGIVVVVEGTSVIPQKDLNLNTANRPLSQLSLLGCLLSSTGIPCISCEPAARVHTTCPQPNPELLN